MTDRPKRVGDYGKGKRTPKGEWNLDMIGVLLGTRGVLMGKYVNGQQYPSLRMIKKLEVLLGWKAQAQLDLIPIHGIDLRYSMVLRHELEEWKLQNPRTTPAADLRSLFPSRLPDPFGWKAQQ